MWELYHEVSVTTFFFTRDKINFVNTLKPTNLTCFPASEIYTAWSLEKLKRDPLSCVSIPANMTG
jgi:hypothetical protein